MHGRVWNKVVILILASLRELLYGGLCEGSWDRIQCQFSAHRHRLRNYLDKPLGVTIKTSSPPPRAVCCLWGFTNLWPRITSKVRKNVLLIYLVKGLKYGWVREVIIPELATLADESIPLNPLFGGDCGVN